MLAAGGRRRRVYEALGRRLKFDPNDKEAARHVGHDRGREVLRRSSSGLSALFLAVIGSFTLMVGGLGVSNIMYVVVEERTREIGVKLAVGAKPRFIQMQFLLETLTLTAIGGVLGFLITLGVLCRLPLPELDEYVGTPRPRRRGRGDRGAPRADRHRGRLFPARRASLLDPVAALKLS